MFRTAHPPFVGAALLAALCLPVPAWGQDKDEQPDPALAAVVPYGLREDVRQFAVEFAAEHGFAESEVRTILSRGRHRASILRIMARTPEGTWDWGRYRKLVDERRITGGLEFWDKYAETLARAEEVYGVPPEYVLGVLGMETRYGTITGTYRVLDALMTLGFDYPRRAKFFRKELGQFLLMVREEGFDPEEVLGSYAGAIGYGQFIPSSYRHFAVDFDGDGVRDLRLNPHDAIGSIASYLAEHGWRRDGQVVLDADLVGEEKDLTFNRFGKRRGMKLQKTAQVLAPRTPVPADEPLVWPVRLVDGEPSYYLGLANFHAITRYNHSRLYAMAVVELARRIAERRAAAP